MPKNAFIDPQALSRLRDSLVSLHASHDLEPSAPHQFDVLPAEEQISETPIATTSQSGAPILQMHSEDLEDLRAEFSDPALRTAERLNVVLDEVAEETTAVFRLEQDLLWGKANKSVIEDEVQDYRQDFRAYTRRLLSYRHALAELEPTSTDTDIVYIGLIERREGAGHLPDALMAQYFAERLGIIAAHKVEVGGFGERIRSRLEQLENASKAAAESVSDTKKGMEEGARRVQGKVQRTMLWVGGAVVTAGLLFAGTLALTGRKST